MPDIPVLQVRVRAAIGALDLQAEFALTSRWSAIFGPSGSGKSSLLRLIAGLWRPNSAEVLLGTEKLTDLPPHRRRISMVTQQPALFPHMTVQANIAFGAKTSDAQWIKDLIEAFGLETLVRSRPATLSGGERQRVAIARALAPRPRYLLLDEVFTGMHRPQQDALIGKLKSYSERLNMPILSVTHDVAEALASAEQIIRIEDGKPIAQGPPPQVLADEITTLRERLS